VITQIELPPYRGPHSPLDLVPSKIVLGRIFEVFLWMSQASTDAAATLAGGDNPPLKRTHVVTHEEDPNDQVHLLLF
jgi:hypothetical protein